MVLIPQFELSFCLEKQTTIPIYIMIDRYKDTQTDRQTDKSINYNSQIHMQIDRSLILLKGNVAETVATLAVVWD